MKKTQIIAGLLTATLIAASFAGCGEKAENQDVSSDVSAVKQEQPQGQEQDQKAAQGQRGTMAKVVSLAGNQLTVFPADMPDRAREGQTPPDGGNPPVPPGDGGNPPATGPAIDGAAGQPGYPGQPGQGGGKIEFTGEEVTYTLSDNVSIMKGAGDSAAEIDLSELKVDDVIRFTTMPGDNGNEVIDTIVVLE